MPEVAYSLTGVKKLVWLGSAKDDLVEFPEEVRRTMGYALYLAQTGGKHPDAKPLKGFGGAGVVEVVDDFDGDTYRTVYTIKFVSAVYVLHAFQKKSKRGSRTPQEDMAIIETRLKRARELNEKGSS